MTTRKYSSRSQQTTLTAAVTSGATVIPVANATTLFGGATVSTGQTFTIVIDPDTALEEIVEITSASSNNLTVTRAVDMSGASAQDHSAGAVVRHMVIGRDLREANLHIEATGGYNDGTGAHTLHGLAVADGAVVGTDAVQTLTNKTLTSPILTGTLENDASITFEGATADAYETTLTVVDPTADRTITLPNATGTVVLKDTTDTLTNKTLTSPTISGSPVITGLSSAGMSASSAAPKDYVDAILVLQTAQATAAATSAASAATSATAAATSASSAGTSATAAATSATSSATQATAAATSAASAATSQTAAATSATSAAASATAAATSATSAAASATASATSATAAATSATSAAASATAAAAAVTSAIQLTTIDAKGDLIVGTANDAASRLGVGTNSQILTADSAQTTGLKWADAPAGYTAPVLGSTTIASGATVSNVNGLTVNSTTIPTSKTLVVTTDKLSVHAATTSAELAGVISDETGTGSLVFASTPTLVTPVLGVATATSINGTTIPSSKTLVATDSTAYVVPTQTGNSGKYLTTDGTTSSWGVVAGALAQPTEPTSPSDGQIWIDTDGTAPTTVVTRWTKQPAAGTTSLTGNDDYSIPLAYSAGYEEVFLNGVLLSRSAGEYTATSGTAITLASATVASDIVEVICPLQIATTDTYTQSAVNAAFLPNTANFTAGKNKILNSDFRIAQRGTSFNTASTGWNYTLDQWMAYTFSASTVTLTQQTFTPGTSPVAGYEGSNFLRINSTNTSAQIGQRIEDVRTLAGQTATLSFWAKSGSAQTLGVLQLSQKFGTGGSADVDTNLTLPTLTTSWVRYTATVSVPSISGKTIGAGSNLQLTISGAINNALDIWGIQLEAGSTATAFQTATGTIQGELAACQRYYYRTNPLTQSFADIVQGQAAGTTDVRFILRMPTTMRTTPTAVEFSTLRCSDYVNNLSVSSINGSLYTPDSIELQATVTGATQFRPYILQGNNSTSAYIGVTAEL